MNLVNELQESAEKEDVLTVLRKTKRLASKLGRQDISDWLKSEQGGYSAEQKVPDYRMITTSLAFSTNGYIPAGYGQLMNGVQELPSNGLTVPTRLPDSISSIISMLEDLKTGKGLYYNLDGTDYGKSLRLLYKFHPSISRQVSLLLHYNQSQVEAIPDQIKDKVLDWACDLEAAGVTGEGLTFSAKEKEIAHSITFNIYNSTIDQLNNMGTNQRGIA